MKKLVLRNWIDKILKIFTLISFSLIVCTIDSEWTCEYLIFLTINFIIFIVNSKILIKYSKNI